MKPFLAVDWGTTNLRGWRVSASGDVEAEVELPLGVSRLAGQSAAECFAKHVRAALGGAHLPALLCGMVGSNLGWRVAPYAPCPADAKTLLPRILTVETAPALVRIVPGLVCEGAAGLPDVMRGEETQVLGWVARNPARQSGRHLVCHPGTHSKWVRVVDGAITHFSTAVTGELFDVLRKASVIGKGAIDDDAAEFAAGLAAAGNGSALIARLFSTRARVVTGRADAERAPSFLSGLLIGAEIGSLPEMIGAEPLETVHVIGSPRLAELYRTALQRAGWRASVEDGEDAVLSGLRRLVDCGALDDT